MLGRSFRKPISSYGNLPNERWCQRCAPPSLEEESWRQTHFNTIANTGDAADDANPDHDNLTNLLEFATGHLPKRPDGTITYLTKSGPELEFTYPRSHAAVAHRIAFAVERSDALGSDWTTNQISEAPLPGTDNGATQLWRAAAPVGTSKRLLHLRITIP